MNRAFFRVVFPMFSLLGLVIPCLAYDWDLRLVMQVSESECRGSQKEIVVQVRNSVYFLDEKGALARKIKIENGDYCRLPQNHGFAAVSHNNADAAGLHGRLLLYDFSGRVLWQNHYPFYVRPLAVANDGQRVLAECFGDDDDNVTIVKYLGIGGKEIASLAGAEIPDPDRAVSPNCRFWTCVEDERWAFYDGDGRRVRTQAMPSLDLEGLFDNGSYILHDEQGDHLYDFGGRKVGSYRLLMQSKNGDTLYFAEGSDYAYVSKGKKTVIRRKDLPQNRTCCGMASDGSFVLYRSPSNGEFEYMIYFVSAGGSIGVERMSTQGLGSPDAVYEEIIAERRLLAIWAPDFSKCNFYSID